jgi:hypothetical protein
MLNELGVQAVDERPEQHGAYFLSLANRTPANYETREMVP